MLEVTLRFQTDADRERFMGGLSDGWGENYCILSWPQDVPFSECRAFNVLVPSEEEMQAVIEAEEAARLGPVIERLEAALASQPDAEERWNPGVIGVD